VVGEGECGSDVGTLTDSDIGDYMRYFDSGCKPALRVLSYMDTQPSTELTFAGFVDFVEFLLLSYKSHWTDITNRRPDDVVPEPAIRTIPK